MTKGANVKPSMAEDLARVWGDDRADHWDLALQSARMMISRREVREIV